MDYINSITEAIGRTPLLKLNKIGKNCKANIFAKLEYLNPSGSYKDRMALAMLEAAEHGETWNGRVLSPGGTVVEASAGNTAPAIAMVCAAKDYRAKFVLYRYQMESATNSRLQITKAFGPDVIVSSPPEKYMSSNDILSLALKSPDLPDVVAAKKDCAIMEEQDSQCVWVDQIYNEYNVIGQMKMAKEIYEQLDGKIDAIGCSVGAGGSLFGLCKGLSSLNFRPEITFGIVPYGSENYLELDADEADREGFRYADCCTSLAKAMGLDKWVNEKSLVQKMLEAGYPDKFFRITNEEAKEMADRLCKEEGIYCGMSSGANVAVALKIAQRLELNKNVVTVIVDRRDRYLSEIPNEKYVV